MAKLYRERKQIIAEEIPESHDTCGYAFGGIKVHPLLFLCELKNNKVIDKQPEHRNKQKLTELREYIRIMALEGPESV
jgi:hypothetical protein